MQKITIQTTPTLRSFCKLVASTLSSRLIQKPKSCYPVDCHQSTVLNRQTMSGLLPLSAALVLCIVISIPQTAVAQLTFTNQTPIAETGSADVNPCIPYPSSIAVSGVPGLVTKVTVTVNKLNVDDPPDANILLVGPNGQNIILMSDAGDRTGIINALTLTFDDAALSALPSDLTIMSGTYKPTNFNAGNDSFPAPAPVGPYGATLAVFNGSNPNGTWDLYVANNKGNHPWDYTGVGISGGWSLTVTTSTQSQAVNPIDQSPFFIRQHYLDFLNREPEPAGLDAWLRVLNSCPDLNNDPSCDRIMVSAAFFGSQEFQLKGVFAFHFYKLAFVRLPAYDEIVRDMQSLNGQTPDAVYANKALFAKSFTERPEFVTQFGTLSNTDFVIALMNRYQLEGIVTLSPTNPDGSAKLTLTRSDLIQLLENNVVSRAQILRAIADSDEVFQFEYNPSFVAMQYYGYLRRAPEEVGYNAWLNYLNAHPKDFRTMVNGFMNSIEYRARFGS